MNAVIIANPAARGIGSEQVAELEHLCRNHIGDVTVRWTTAPGDATSIAESSVEASLILAVGGDGTAREVVHGMTGGGSAAMFIVPAGTANSCYRSFWGELPWQQALAEALTKPRPRKLDLALLKENDKLVLAGAATGFPPQAIHLAETMTGLTGRARYEKALLDLAISFEPYPGRVTVDGITVHSGSTMLANVGGSRYRGGQFEVLPHSIIDDGLLDVCIIGGDHDPADMLRAARAGEHVTASGVVYARGRHITLERTDGQPLWFEHDGEVLAGGGNQFTLDVIPNAVPVLIGTAADAGRPVFGH
jgi:diacylglycerol kinase (ATP)